MNKQYFFLTKWVIKSPVQPVWDAIYSSEFWPSWWKGVISVEEIKKGDDNGLGSIRVYMLRSPLYYSLKFELLLTDRQDLRFLKGNASGDLVGTGAWYFNESEGVTTVECHWHVETTIKWMNAFAPLLSPLFSYNHKIVMQQGAKCLAQKLNAELISY
jgi:hypothetical protein